MFRKNMTKKRNEFLVSLPPLTCFIIRGAITNYELSITHSYTMSLITVSSLSKSFGAEDLFGGVTFSVAKGARLALVGPNGIGKTTLLRILIGDEEPPAERSHAPRVCASATSRKRRTSN